jgi:hypothetical protein
VLLTSYVGRLRKAFAPEDFDQIFRPDAQLGLFDRPIETIQPLWIRCEEQGRTLGSSDRDTEYKDEFRGKMC